MDDRYDSTNGASTMTGDHLQRITMTVCMAAIGLVGCGDVGDSGQDAETQQLCEDATDHVQSCFPDQSVRQPEECTAESAERTLAQSCEELESSDGKADSWCNPWLWWTCGSSSTTDTTTIKVYVEACHSDVCGTVSGASSCALMVLADAEGEEVARAYTNRYSSATFEDLELESGDYTVSLYRRDGTVAEMMTEREFEFGRPGRAEATLPVEVDGEGQQLDLRMYVSRDERESLRRCARADGRLESMCDGEEMEREETEWSWFVEFSGTNDAGEYVDITRPFGVYEVGNVFSSTDLLPGVYQVTFHEMDIPSYRRRNNPDYDRLLRYYSTGREISETIEITEDQMATSIDLGEYQLDHRECR
jgi:hypothetical protein